MLDWCRWKRPRGAAISGVVVDDSGEPIAGASVMVERAGPTGRPRPPIHVGMTDELGEYRVGSLPQQLIDAAECILRPGGR